MLDGVELVEEDDDDEHDRVSVAGHSAGPHRRPGPLWSHSSAQDEGAASAATIGDYATMTPSDVSSAAVIAHVDVFPVSSPQHTRRGDGSEPLASLVAKTAAIDAAVKEAESKLMQLQLLRQHALAESSISLRGDAGVHLPLNTGTEPPKSPRTVDSSTASTALYAIPVPSAKRRELETRQQRAAEEAAQNAAAIADAENRLLHLQLLRNQVRTPGITLFDCVEIMCVCVCVCLLHME